MVTRFQIRTAAVVAATATSFVLAGPPAFAQPAEIVVQAPPPETLRVERVPFYDLNLATLAGEQTLRRRVGHAVERVCLYDRGRWYGLAVPDYNQCASRSWSRARPQMIGAVYRARQLAYYRGY